MYEALVRRLHELEIVRPGKIVLAHAGPADFYVDIKKAYGDPLARRLICNALERVLDPAATCIAGSGHGGITPVSILADRYSKRLTLVREKPKEHGPGGVIDGYVPQSHDSIAIIDDVCTTGKTLQLVIDTLRPTGATILSCSVVVLRGTPPAFDVPLRHILTLEDLLNA